MFRTPWSVSSDSVLHDRTPREGTMPVRFSTRCPNSDYLGFEAFRSHAAWRPDVVGTVTMRAVILASEPAVSTLKFDRAAIFLDSSVF